MTYFYQNTRYNFKILKIEFHIINNSIITISIVRITFVKIMFCIQHKRFDIHRFIYL